jgi:hypothetical protein
MSVNDYDEVLYARIQDLDLDEKSAAYGIAMKVVYEGYDSLSAKQRYVYDAEVIPLLREQADEEEHNRRSRKLD